MNTGVGWLVGSLVGSLVGQSQAISSTSVATKSATLLALCALCCHSNATGAPIANQPNSAQLGAASTTPPSYIRIANASYGSYAHAVFASVNSSSIRPSESEIKNLSLLLTKCVTCTDPDVTWGRGRGWPLVVHY